MFSLVLAWVTAVAAAGPGAGLPQRLDALVARHAGKAQIGLVVADLDSGRSVFELNPDQPLKPASVLKLLTTAAALQRFGPDFTYQTELYLHRDELWVRQR
jgi:D-alanyl-D-alanine carboxypeptidase/D-alanyl-D-alanine-endopeptidase (penicillin-binding protein 4)